ncbi:unnamed protein product [Ostreobium quekettii]|uniref:Uncharacterized protein n=1 Tax=Ostreobium quekettii TaxID=121088 RepID=A0A8S1J6M9_9CHLO|nr:unnamed protein product [Ostreobium quekettii]
MLHCSSYCKGSGGGTWATVTPASGARRRFLRFAVGLLSSALHWFCIVPFGYTVVLFLTATQLLACSVLQCTAAAVLNNIQCAVSPLPWSSDLFTNATGNNRPFHEADDHSTCIL